MSEETLDDCHAFTDVTPSGRRSGTRITSDSSIPGEIPSSNNSVLEMLKEEEDDEDSELSDEDEPRKNDRKGTVQKVILELEKVEEIVGRE